MREISLSNSVCSDLCTKDILICDDESFNLLILSAMLSDFTIESLGFESGAKAVNCFRQRLSAQCCSRMFKLVLTDISMPGMDGFEVCTQIMAT
jgi:CheY-like chemotaxis protein